MKVTIDATPILVRSAGVKSYLFHWIEALRDVAGPHSLATWPRLGAHATLDHERSPLSALATFAHLGRAALARYAAWAPPRRGADVFHASNLVRRAPRGVRITATLHDLTCWLMPEFHARGNIAADFAFAAQILVRADAVIAISEHTRRDALRVLRLKPEKVHTIHPGVAAAYFQQPAPETQPRPYVLYTGAVEPRKNLDRLLDAWLAMPREYRRAFELRIAGPTGWRAESTEARMEAAEGVRRLGYVPEAQLPELFRRASLFVYPSLYEGFGLPVAQAMASGVPVITSHVSSLPEVAGDAAEYVNPRSTVDLAAALRRLLDDPARRASLGAAGRERAARFQWSRCAEATWRLLESLAG
jgi:glycosyltransferase involved in cell wall biosynthesis